MPAPGLWVFPYRGPLLGPIYGGFIPSAFAKELGPCNEVDTANRGLLKCRCSM